MQIGDSTLLSMFGFPLAYGDPKTALCEPNTVVITSALAQKYFSETNVLRRQLTIQTPGAGKQVFTITGVLSDQANPYNSVTHFIRATGAVVCFHAQLRLFLDASGLLTFLGEPEHRHLRMWNYNRGTSAEQLSQPFAQTLKTHAPPDIQANLQTLPESVAYFSSESR